MMKHLFFSLFALFFAPLFFAGAALANDNVTISYVVPTVIYGDLLVGLDNGYFADEGMDVTLLQAGGGAATPALIAGDVQFSGSPAAAISAILKGAHLKVLYITTDHAAYQLWTRGDIKTIEDLKGQQVGIITRGDTSEIALRYYLVRRNLPQDYVSYTPLGAGAPRVAAITSGSYSASLIDKVEVQELKTNGSLAKLHLLADLHKDVEMTFSGLAASDALIAKNPDLVRRAMRAVIKGMTLAKQDRNIAIKASMNHGVKDRSAAEADYDGAVHDLSLTGDMPLEAQRIELKVRGEMLSLAADKILPPNQVFDFSFAKKAAAELKAENWKPKK
jgi:ABC-type nitrate/sulfonate/bicarbonate transport system substrate-binding protein